ncbi:MAG: N-glycosyltransferase [Planctomycetes bacterium ADurb.Bin401]|nr:MAG: N-glycosyltransferase [Planctomycetes bacterium ADurb.Bin401]
MMTYNNLKTVIVMPAYNASATLEATLKDIPQQFHRDIILVDDCSKDNTVEIAEKLGLTVIRHEQNKGYGGNQKTC